jgi:hypothetical protein
MKRGNAGDVNNDLACRRAVGGRIDSRHQQGTLSVLCDQLKNFRD